MRLRCFAVRAVAAAASAAVAVAGAACGPYDATAKAGKAGLVLRLGLSEPAGIDPATAYEVNGVLVTKLLFEGLLTADDATGEVRPGVAESWEGNEDCTAWTFHLRPDAAFSTGEAVTASSFIAGMTRAADGRSVSDVAYRMAGIVGYDALHGTEDDPKPSTGHFEGLRAPDPRTLEVALADPDCEFDQKALHTVFSPVPASATVPAKEDRAMRDAPIGNGPFRMAAPWRHDRGISLARNDAYRGPRPDLDGVDITILPEEGGSGARYRYFRVGRFDLAYVPPALVPQAKATYGRRGGLVAAGSASTSFLVPRIDKAPLSDARVRQAISLAIDRPAIMAGIYQGAQRAADSLVPPVLGDGYRAGVCGACGHDPDRARALAAEAGLEPGTALPLHYEAESPDEAGVAAIAEQLRSVLGLAVDLVPLPANEFYDEESSDDGEGLFMDAWTAEYLTADGFLSPLLASDSADNASRYRSDTFDDLLAQERAAPDRAERLDLVHRAEELGIGADMAVIPLWYSTEHLALNTKRFAGITLDPFGAPTIAHARPAP